MTEWSIPAIIEYQRYLGDPSSARSYSNPRLVGSWPVRAMISDLDLINRIKKERDSGAVTELVNRHTGIYMNVLDEYSARASFRHRANVTDLKQDHYINIYQWALKYDSSRGMQFGSYVGNMTKYMCKSIITKGTESIEIDEEKLVSPEEGIQQSVENESVLAEAKAEVKDSGDPLFKKIFKLRYGGKRQMSWREVGQAVGLTHEGARKFFNKHMGLIKEHAAA